MALYVVDSNFFIQAHRVTYPLDVATSFWNKVRELAERGLIVSIDKVENEIYKNEDALREWCIENLPADFFKDTKSILNSYRQVVAWAMSRSEHYRQKALSVFLDVDEADAFVVAYALADSANRIVVTQEKSEPESKKDIKIPDACNALGVESVNTVDMYRRLGESF